MFLSTNYCLVTSFFEARKFDDNFFITLYLINLTQVIFTDAHKALTAAIRHIPRDTVHKYCS